ncbi:MAG: signal peptide peptidase SppA [Acidobacteriota bacterium]|nr:signal peptide peptidase SppA [Blastocatellia bacterium]MDW8413806.1 signal peptide peptidase SppA [Acidobacteriota bacterium]
MSNKTKTVIAILVAGVVLAVIFGVILAYSLYKAGPAVVADSVLEYKLEGEIADAPSPMPQAQVVFLRLPQSLFTITRGIRRAKNDSRIKALLLTVNSPEIGYAKVEELREAIKDFRSSGKPVYVYMDRGSDRDYYLATAADKIYLSPAGDLDVKGFLVSATFLRGLFDKLKITPNVERHGKYKSFADTYTRSDMSQENREQLSALLDDLYARYTQAIAEARKIEPEQVKRLIDSGPYSNAAKATAAGLIDGGVYLDELKERIRSELSLREYKAVSGKDYSESYSWMAKKVAVIYATGAIVPGRSGSNPLTGQVMGSQTIASAIKTAREDNDVSAVILRIDSPGGSALASDLIWREVVLTKQKKPIVASMSDVAASGGYYIAMAASKIVAQPSTITGSIGVVSGKLDLSGLYREHLGINVETIKRGENADYYSEQQSFTEEQRAKFRQDVLDMYEMFVKKAAEGRSKTLEEIDKVAQGRVWSGVRAKELGLVDELGGLDKALEIARQLASIPAGQALTIVEYPQPPTVFDLMFGKEDQLEEMEIKGLSAMIQSLPAEVRETLRLAYLMRYFDEEQAFAIMPYTIRVR